jgi:hypothetical protein
MRVFSRDNDTYEPRAMYTKKTYHIPNATLYLNRKKLGKRALLNSVLPPIKIIS